MDTKTRFAVRSLKTLIAYYSRQGLISHLGRERKRSGNVAFRVLIGTILSHRTKDERTELASKALLAKYATPQALSKASLGEVRRLIKPVGFYNSKARYVVECSRELVERFSGRIPDNVSDLVTLTGVGRKTAGCVVAYAFGKPAIPVDSHVHQVSNRLGLVETKTPLQTELALELLLPKPLWKDVNEAFVVHGQNVCVPISPHCSKCPLRGKCPRTGVAHSR
ncbi:hypothetical protein AUJ14_04225 [Candidatus Micrarchaeota archaeon CG1_02_55_22]|nr:MAG: hypothetical protein AUJ14_04225 [Candidatus Micrarchaeota archaeon CG1_02_55_22]